LKTRIEFRLWTVPIALTALAVVAYGFLLPQLGFFWDDWPLILVQRVFGANGFWNFFSFDRPISAWTYVLFAPLLGEVPINWHIFALVLRIITAICMWWTLTGLWPGHKNQAAAASLLFLVYPSFTQQAIAVTYRQLWIEFIFFFVSLAAMIQAVRRPQRFWLFTALSLAAFLLNLSISEYFLGLELLRPVFLWILLDQETGARPRRALKTVKLWLPYLAILLVYIIWRLFFERLTAGDPNKPYLLYGLFSNPISSTIKLIQIALQDIVRILVSTWYRTLDPALVDLTRSFFLLTWMLIALTGIAVAFYTLHLSESQENTGKAHGSWSQQAMLVGLLAVILGPLPAWITGRQVVNDLFTDRFTAAAMFGASLLFTGIIDWLTPHRLQRAIILGVLIGLATGAQLRTANDYRWRWVAQTRFFWQLSWRAPQIKPQTPILAIDDVFPDQGRFATTVALNLAYPQQPGVDLMPYWVFSLDPGFKNQMPELLNGMKLDDSFRTFKFLGASKDSLVIYNDPERTHCLWVIDPKRASALDLPDLVREASATSNLTRIGSQSAPGYPPVGIFGPEPKDSWCYYFEKADLAGQNKDWRQVAALGDEARAKGYSPTSSGSNIPFEWYPFIEGYARVGRWDDVSDLTLGLSEAKHFTVIDERVCTFWQEILENTPSSAEKSAISGKVIAQFQCTQAALH
jgi:hypothetical protein